MLSFARCLRRKHTSANLILAALVLPAFVASKSTAASPTSVPPGPVVVIGVDGMTFDVLNPLIEAGKAPHFARLASEGATAVLNSENPMRSPALWTTIATGQPRKVHQIYDFVTGSNYWPRSQRDVPQKLVTSDMRASEAIWQWVGRAGRRSLVVGWLNTWPAEAINGVMVAPYVALGQARQTSIKGKIYNDVASQTWPRELFSKEGGIRSQIVPTDAIDAARISTMIDVPESDSPLYKAMPQLRRYMYTVRWSIASALTNTRIVERQLKERPFDLVMTYFDGSDTLAHRFWLFRQSVEEIEARLRAHDMPVEHAAELKRRFSRTIDGYYQFVDEMLGRITAAAGDNATIIVLSDHGWGTLSSGDKAPHEHVPFDGEHRMEGVFLARGPGVKRIRLPAMTLYDVAPTASLLMGLEPPDELASHGVTALLLPHMYPAKPVKLVARHPAPEAKEPHRPAAKGTDNPFREQELERLRSLGYVQ